MKSGKGTASKDNVIPAPNSPHFSEPHSVNSSGYAIFPIINPLKILKADILPLLEDSLVLKVKNISSRM